MFVFYDFETSDKDFLGQILSYSFMLADEDYRIIYEKNGIIKPNRLELPSMGAILTNKLNINDLITSGQTEFDAATDIYNTIESWVNEYGAIQLVGFNSARFDFKHFEKLLLKYGLSPTFFGKVSSLDVLQFARACALQDPNNFPFTLKESETASYYSFKLEDLASAFNCLDAPQTHDARDDVLLTIELLKKLEQTCNLSLQSFQKTQHKTDHFTQSNVLVETSFSYQQLNEKPSIKNTEWLMIGKASKSTVILLDINAYKQQKPTEFEGYQPITRYLNTRTTFFNPTNSYPLPTEYAEILIDPNVKKITENAIRYFKLFPVNWDIEYRPWAMGFDNISYLRQAIFKLKEAPNSYNKIIKELVDYRNNSSKKDEANMMIQLFNRYYLNYHPNPPTKHLQKYLFPRYVQKTLYRNPDDAVCPTAQKIALTNHLAVASSDSDILTALLNYQQIFEQQLKLTT